MKKKPIIAICYDFDKTLCDNDMQNYSFIPNLGMTPLEFWNDIAKFQKENQVEGILAYLYCMIQKAKEKNIQISREYLQSCGKNVRLYPGVREWFNRINEYGKENGVIIEHYIISSGNKDIILGTEIANEFKQIFACDFFYNENGEAVWPKIAINYTLKTQYLYRINKGVLTELGNDNEVNEKTVEKRIPFKNMIYIGDGLTDIPCMIMLKKNNGKSIGLYTKDTEDRVAQFLRDDRINFMCKADYRLNSKLDKIVKLIISSTAIQNELEKEEDKQIKSVLGD